MNVAVRRLHTRPFAFDDDAAAAGGAVLHLPADEAAMLIQRGGAFRVIPSGEPLAAGPLAAVIRDTLACDGEQAGLQAAVQAYARRWRAAHLLQALPLPRLLARRRPTRPMPSASLRAAGTRRRRGSAPVSTMRKQRCCCTTCAAVEGCCSPISSTRCAAAGCRQPPFYRPVAAARTCPPTCGHRRRWRSTFMTPLWLAA